ncbi:MAG: cytochrome c [Saprospiraceae bacterium]
MKFIQQPNLALLTLFLIGGLFACQQPGGESTGSEFIPDMAHSVAYEANVTTDYSLNSWDKESVASRRELSMPHLPVKGTIPRGYSGVAINDGTFESATQAVANTMSHMKNDGGIAYTPNGSVPYYYPDTEDGRNLAIEQIKYNPFPITQAGIAKGQELYTYYCGICHGDKGDGGGYLVRDNGGKYPAQPANFLLEEFVNASNGRYYHGIMYGKNAMGAYADKLSYEERWDVIHYIRSLQAKSLKVAYNHEVNQLNPDFGVPQAMVKTVAEVVKEEMPVTEEENGGEDHTHGEDAGNDHGHGH